LIPAALSTEERAYDWTMDSRSVGALIIVVGVIAVIIGVLVATGALAWFGRLPGDIRIEGENSRVFIPITSMILVSIVVSLLLSVLRRWF
jgi:NAD/NADP transhydrogenase beta subunit